MVCYHVSETLPKIVYGYLAQSRANIDFQFLHCIPNCLCKMFMHLLEECLANHPTIKWDHGLNKAVGIRILVLIELVGLTTPETILLHAACGSVHNCPRLQTTILKLFPVSYQYATWWLMILDSMVPFGQGKDPVWRPSQIKGLMMMCSEVQPHPVHWYLSEVNGS